MTQRTCGMPACDKPTDGYVCRSCFADHVKDLNETPWLLDELATVLARQTRYSSGGGPASRERPLPIDLRATIARHEYARAIRALVVALDTKGRTPTNNTRAHARWLLSHDEQLRFRPDAPDLIHAADRTFAYARYLIDRPAERWFAGPCVTCQRDLYAEPGATTVTCKPCGLHYDVTERRDYLLAEAEDRLVNATTLARAVTWLGEESLPRNRVYQWAHVGRIRAKATDRCRAHLHVATPPRCKACEPLYRVGDALDLLAADAEKAQPRRKS